MRTVLYVRLSVHRGDADPSTSPEGQEAACRAYCEAQGWPVDDVVTDLDVTGGSKGLRLDRPGIKRLREIGAERVVFLKIDRVARNVKDFLTLSEEFALVSVKDNLDLSTPMGRFVATILAAFAEMELSVIRDRVKDGRAILDAQKRFAGGVVPYGYRVVDNPDGNGKILAPDPDEAPLWQTVATGILAGRSLRIQARYLNHKGVTSRRGETITYNTVRDVLSGDAIVGRKNGVQVWEPAIDLETWAQLRGIFEARKLPEGRRRGKNTTLLSTVMTCAGCGGPLWISNDRGTFYARCSTRISRDESTCDAPASVKYASLEDMVLERIEATAKERPVVVRGRLGTDPVALRDAEDALEAAQARLRAAETEDEESAALAARRAARATLDALSKTTGQPVLRITGERVWDVLMAEDIDAAARAMQQVVSRVIVTKGRTPNTGVLDPARVELEWAEYTEPGPVAPHVIRRGGEILNLPEIERYEERTGNKVPR
ncbi:recombinase family protein [Promicromonospora kroppenstedtii]|uniref:recombinase family protein n=1 Tax=Promicromonospora kroppenstedtii TaxID=440482 RepID=UPI0009FD38BF|nr:recombinase family protein [Promicromonospora kroppenstedtii]